ncbi:amylo-alpha-1,6-glucosidase [Cognatiluteimonas lumbrici]|uniref:amylo-alpha-1,6-glucosidase n=1 Tax=Cognatiluteimonas lumbrici TaxID=2559601 RepID=UPI001128C4BB|nr:glycogen debranching N-terminal domain-containing protein [Luteimonas lumbrici]
MSPPLGDVARSIARLQVRADALLVSRGDTVLSTQRDGFIEPGEEQGLFVHETRMLSLYRCRIGRQRPYPAAVSNIRQDHWMGYYIVRAPGQGGEGGEEGGVRAASQEALELRVTRVVGEGMHEDLDLTNYTQQPTSFRLSFELDADFADLDETQGERKQKGTLKRRWKRSGDGGELRFDYRAEHAYDEQGHRGTARTERSLVLSITQADSPPLRRGRRIWFDIELPPRGRWHACFSWKAIVDGDTLEPPCCTRTRDGDGDGPGSGDQAWQDEATHFETPESRTLTPVVIEALERARGDLAALRLHRLDRGERAWTVTAGLPMFLALFGRDSLTAGWQSALLGPEIMRGTLPALADCQGSRDDPWRDEQPGRVLHEAHTGPLGKLRFKPKARDYFSLTASGLYPFVVAQLWQWTGDRDAVAPLIDPALRALHWLDTHARDERGFYAIGTRSEQGMDNQTWKDSGDALVDEHGNKCEQPVATCEEQAIVYAAKLALADVLRDFGRKDEARAMRRQAQELQRRFNEAYWMPDAGFFAMGLDPKGRQVRSIGSNALHCMALGIAEAELAPTVMERLFQPDLFSGWGIRTLSSEHPAYNPYAYHRGTIWPVEHGPFVVGGYRYGCHAEAERVCSAMFQAAALFQYRRLPECFAGHPRDDDHPFPAIYPAANVPQAWSASTVVTMLQAMLGVYAHAPSGVLYLDPRLPEWLPEITLRNLRVGEAGLDLRFARQADGTSTYEILDQRGKLEARRRAIPFGADL